MRDTICDDRTFDAIDVGEAGVVHRRGHLRKAITPLTTSAVVVGTRVAVVVGRRA